MRPKKIIRGALADQEELQEALDGDGEAMGIGSGVLPFGRGVLLLEVPVASGPIIPVAVEVLQGQNHFTRGPQVLVGSIYHSNRLWALLLTQPFG